jgi:hypothetical protein
MEDHFLKLDGKPEVNLIKMCKKLWEELPEENKIKILELERKKQKDK